MTKPSSSFDDDVEDSLGFRRSSLDPPSMDYFFRAAESTIQQQRQQQQQVRLRKVEDDEDRKDQSMLLDSRFSHMASNGRNLMNTTDGRSATILKNGSRENLRMQNGMMTDSLDTRFFRESKQQYSHHALNGRNIEDSVDRGDITPRFAISSPIHSTSNRNDNIDNSHTVSRGGRPPRLNNLPNPLDYAYPDLNEVGGHQQSSTEQHRPHADDRQRKDSTTVENLAHIYRKLQHRALARLPTKNGPGKAARMTVSQVLNSNALQLSDDHDGNVSSHHVVSRDRSPDTKSDNKTLPISPAIASSYMTSSYLQTATSLATSNVHVTDPTSCTPVNIPPSHEFTAPTWVAKATISPHKIPRAISTPNGLVVSRPGLQSRRVVKPVSSFQGRQLRPIAAHPKQMVPQRQAELVGYNRPRLPQSMALAPTGELYPDQLRDISPSPTQQPVGVVVPKVSQQHANPQRILIPVQTSAGNTQVVSATLEPPRDLSRYKRGVKPTAIQQRGRQFQMTEDQERDEEYRYRLGLAMERQNREVEPNNEALMTTMKRRNPSPLPVSNIPQGHNHPHHFENIHHNDTQPIGDCGPHHCSHSHGHYNQHDPNYNHHDAHQLTYLNNQQPYYYEDECEWDDEEDDIDSQPMSTVSTFRKPGKPLLEGVLPDLSDMFPDWRSRRQSFQRRTKKPTKGRCGC